MHFESRKTKSAREAALRNAMNAILEGLPAPVEITLSGNSRRLRALLRNAPYLCIELEARSQDLPLLARILTPSSEETSTLPWNIPKKIQGDFPPKIQGDFPPKNLPEEKTAAEPEHLRKTLRQYLSIESDTPTPMAAERSYRLKVSVLSDFSYLPHWEELGHTDVRIGTDTCIGKERDKGKATPEEA